jgi:hypothetical protein
LAISGSLKRRDLGGAPPVEDLATSPSAANPAPPARQCSTNRSSMAIDDRVNHLRCADRQNAAVDVLVIRSNSRQTQYRASGAPFPIRLELN